MNVKEVRKADLHDAPRRGVVAVCFRRGEFLVIERSRHVEAPGAFCFPGGALEPGESEEEALHREMLEELQARVRPVRSLWRSQTPWRVDLSWWLAALENPAELTPNPAEVASVHWFSPATLRGLSTLLSSNVAFLDALEAGRFTLGEEDSPAG